MRLLIIRDAEALNGFLDGLVVGPVVQPPVLDVREDGIVLLCQRRSKVPGDHHIDVILFRADFCDHFRIRRVKISVKEVLHQHPDSEADGIGFA